MFRLGRRPSRVAQPSLDGSSQTESSAGSSSGAGSAVGRSLVSHNRSAGSSGNQSGWESDRKSVRFNLNKARSAGDGMIAPDEFQGAVDRLLAVNSTAFAVQGVIPLHAPVTLYFQTPTGSCHVLRLPTDVPSRSFDAFVASCEPGYIPTPSKYQNPKYPEAAAQLMPVRNYIQYRSSSSRPVTTSFDISSHPILDTVRRTLLPSSSEGHYLVSSLNRIDCYMAGGYSSHPGMSQMEAGGEEDPVAQVVITLPVRYRGGILQVFKDKNEERFYGRGCLSAGAVPPAPAPGTKASASMGNMEWVAYLAGECDTKVSPLEKGVRINLVYNVYMKSYGPFGPTPRPLITPNDGMLSALSSLLKRSRGRSLAFYLTNTYGISPSHVLADTLVPSLKGSDSALYHALKLYQLTPALRYVAGGFIWPVTSCANIAASSKFLESMKRLAIQSAGDDEDLAIQIEDGGGISLEKEGIVMVTSDHQRRIGRERVAFLEASQGALDFLHVNVCMVVYVG